MPPYAIVLFNGGQIRQRRKDFGAAVRLGTCYMHPLYPIARCIDACREDVADAATSNRTPLSNVPLPTLNASMLAGSVKDAYRVWFPRAAGRRWLVFAISAPW